MPITPSDPKLNTFSHEYSIESEFKRFDLDESRFCLSDQNKRYELCETYPSLLIIPKNLQKSDLMDISYSFIHNEFPVITWHQDGIFILRSAAIWTKFNIQSICLENYFKKLFALSSNCYGVQILRFNDEVDIVDEKAVVNLIQRATPGFVNVHQELTVFNSEVQNAFEAMRCVLQTPSAYSSLQDHFKKLQIYPLITKLLDIAIFGASAMINKRCSLFFKHKSPKGPYCIVLCLIQILVDPYYRTIEGFYKLIQKDWISFGFPFAKSSFHRQQTPHNVRKANNDLNAKSQEAAPYDTPQHSCHIFILFLDCCFQLLIQFCSQFEFNENYLLVFAHELHNCYFLNFLSNNERKYSRFKASYQENSLIYLIDRIRPDLLSSTYNPKNLQPMILPETEHKYLAIWKSLYWRNFPSQKCFKKFHLYYEPY
ncbi:MAG: Myotubularin-related protein 6 [Marteilia pararefringens]